jgi:acetylornithine deacetylase/succinyl-diaminopimelate desuccinylase-like protein
VSREAAISSAVKYFDNGIFAADLSHAVSIPTESQNTNRLTELSTYLESVVAKKLSELGFKVRVLTHPLAKGPFLYAERIEGSSWPTVLGYGHGDVIRGMEADWSPGLSPWKLAERDGRWYGRGVADNKGQHLINFAAQAAVLEARGKLGFNAKWLIEMGEELGSPGLAELCRTQRELLSADVLIASDGPRVSADRPTVFLGARGALLFDLVVTAREGAHHSGNWGGLISNPGIQLAHAIACLVGPSGQIRLPEMLPRDGIPPSVRSALADITIEGGLGAPAIEPSWGEPGLTAAEKVYGWCNMEVLAFETGNAKAPVNAIPPRAWARCQLRHVVGVDQQAVIPAIKRHLERHALGMVKVESVNETPFAATRLDPQHPWAVFAAHSIERSIGARPAVLPNLGGALPNEVFAETLQLPTVWIPHSYPGCSQHAPNEHVPIALIRQALAIMAGVYWDVGELAAEVPR